jgi:hypothetical protein
MPLKINGDDIVFRATKEEGDRWCDSVSQSGLTLSKGKTLIHHRFFSINSTFFCAKSQKVKAVPVIRTSVLVKDCNSPESLQGRVKAFCWGFYGKKKRVMEEFIMSWHAKTARKGHVSWTRGRNSSLGVTELGRLGLLKRELDALEAPESFDRDFDKPVEHESLPREFVKKRTCLYCKDCKHDSIHALSVYQARASWMEKKMENRKSEDEASPEQPEVSFVRRSHRFTIANLVTQIDPATLTITHVGTSQFRRRLQTGRRGMALLWNRPWKKKKRKEEKMWIFSPALCAKCQCREWNEEKAKNLGTRSIRFS